jgi:hypothetical protein
MERGIDSGLPIPFICLLSVMSGGENDDEFEQLPKKTC